MSELDKFKRRTIRSVARLLFQEKKSPEELWAQMKKETGTDCRVLWERMRALCVKKLSRMIAVDDRSASLPGIARLSLTDWLLVDLVLVHEKIDVIMMEKFSGNKEYPALIELFNLVQRFDIEGKQGSRLAEAWAAATVFYNRQGRQCSPMLLQRRWYQLKKLTRSRFYKFWQSYRGNARLLSEARKAMPTRLQMAIAKRYPKVITSEFPDWEQLIEQNLIIMPEEFEAKMRLPNLPKPCHSNDPDLVLVEPVIETIELAGDSDHEGHNEDHIDEFSDPEKSNDATDITGSSNEDQTKSNEASEITVKTEPVEQDGLSNVQVVSATHVPEVEIPDESPEEEKSPNVVAPSKAENLMDDSPDVYGDDIIELQSDVPSVNDDSEPADNTVGGEKVPQEEVHVSKSRTDNVLIPSDDEGDVIEIPSVVPSVNVDLELPTDNNTLQTKAELPSRKESNSSDVVTFNDSDEFDDIIKIKADEFCSKNIEKVHAEKEVAPEIDDLIKDKVETFLKKPKEDTSLVDKKPDISTINLTNNSVELTAIDLMADLNFINDGIEFVDDGVEYVEEDDTPKIGITTKATSYDQTNAGVEENNKFDSKLLMDPVVYTTKLDQMQIFSKKPFDSVENTEDIEMAFIESKPVSKRSFQFKVKQECVPSVADCIAENDEVFTNKEETDEEDDSGDDEIETVSPNSYMLKKPRTRSYDPIKLCKNPDFNTKLKRLTIGFLSSTKNRLLLNACIPMTIDLSKAFESKLVNDTLYLKSSGIVQNIVKQEVIDKHASSILPSAMPVQSLIDSSKGDIQNLISNQPQLLTELVSERQKVIKLPDIEKVRKINQQLLTAQVPPIRVYSGNNHQPRPPTAPAVTSELEVVKEVVVPENPQPVSDTVPYVESNNILPETQNTLPTIIKVKTESSVDQKAALDSEETPPETLPPAKEKLIKIINQAKISTQEALVKIDGSAKPDDFPRPIILNKIKPKIPPEPKKPWRQPRVSLAWAPRYGNAPQNIDDFLLTNDTLEKMLHLLMSGDKDGKGCKCCALKSKKVPLKKGRKSKEADDESEHKETQTNDQSTRKQSDWMEVYLDILDTAQKDKSPPKTPPSAPINIEDSPPQVTVKKPVLARGRVVKYCCWAKQKLCNRKRMTRHMCLPEKCKCCCRDQLAVKLIEDEEKKRKEINKNVAIELSDDEESLRKACESIENVVLQSREIGNGQDNTSDGHPVVIKTDSTNIQFNSASISNLSPGKVSVAVDLSPMRPHEGPAIPTTPPMPPRVITKVVVSPENLVSMVTQKASQPTILRQQLAKPSQLPTCSCQKPALSQDSQRFIVIDGSKNCPLHPVPVAPKQDKVVYIHSKSIAKSPSESPIFLGKNKILLTTVKFPRKGEEDVPVLENVQTPKIIPALPLPAGVQLVLMPSGTVTYTLDPGVELDETELANLPTIIAAVQEQINSSGQAPAPTVDPQVGPNGADIQAVVDPSQPVMSSILPQTGVNTVAEKIETPQPESNLTTGASGLSQTRDNISESAERALTLTTDELFQDTELPARVTNIEHMDVDATESTDVDAATEITSTIDIEKTITPLTEDKTSNMAVDLETPISNIALNDVPVVPSRTPTVGETGVLNETETQETPSSVKTIEEEKKPDDKEGINNKKNLLSDLMEMSGISAEDATVPESAVPVPHINTTQAATNMGMIADQSMNLPELSPVTSFAELKYACEQNGKFFKLDFETGVIVPINVCIKRNPKNKVVQIKPKEFIDLTDDVEYMNTQKPGQVKETAVTAGSSELQNRMEYFYNGKTVSVSNVVKPVKLFRAVRPAPMVLKRSKKIYQTESQFVSKQTHIEKRKQSLTKVDARINLVDSDEPMEEEYLVDSSDDNSRDSDASPMFVESLDFDTLARSDDSSDDEPLAKKFRRLKGSTNDENNVREATDDESPDVPQVPEPSQLTQSVMKDLAAIDKPLLSHDGDLKDLLTQTPQTSQVPHDPVPSASVSNDLVPALNVRSDLVPGGGSPDFLEDDESDKDMMPLLRFLSDQSNEESGDDDCILGV